MAERVNPIRLSTLPPAEREALLADYEREVYFPAFPDEELREDPAYWLGLLAANPYPPPPQPRIEVVLLITDAGQVAGGATIEYYRTARCGLFTYLAIGEAWRAQGLARILTTEARAALADMAGGEVPLFAETERGEDHEDQLRQRRLAALGALHVDFDYVMPPLRPGLPPRPLLLLMPGALESTVSGRLVLGLLTELAAALGTSLDAMPETKAMADLLATGHTLRVTAL